MAEPLTPEWFEEANAAARDRPGPAEPIRIDVVVSDAPSGEIRYSVVAGPEGTEVALDLRGGAPTSVTVLMDHETALALASGRTAPREALLAGRLRAAGDLAALAGKLEILSVLASGRG